MNEPATERFERAEKIADAVLLEGYMLHPYRAAAPKNRYRFTVGVIAPRNYSEHGDERWWMQAQWLLEGPVERVDVRLRFLHHQRRTVEELSSDAGFQQVGSLDVDGALFIAFDEATPVELDFAVSVEDALRGSIEEDFVVAAARETQAILDSHDHQRGLVVRERSRVSGALRFHAEVVDADRGFIRLTARIENTTAWMLGSVARDKALPQSLLSTQLLAHVDAGAFVSLLDPPEQAASAARACTGVGLHSVLAGAAGERDLVLASPVPLADYAAHSGHFDHSEINEVPHEVKKTPILSDVLSVPFLPGDKVRLRPGGGRSDVDDLWNAGMLATVERVEQDVLGCALIAVTLDDDDVAGERRHTRRLYHYRYDELERVDAVSEEKAARVLVAGIGNVSLGDDGFGVDLARRLSSAPWPAGVEIADYGVRGVHLAYRLLEAIDVLVVLDALSRGGPPGTLYVVEPELLDDKVERHTDPAHVLSPRSIFAAAKVLGAALPRILIVGCEPLDVTEGMGLSAPVQLALKSAEALVRDVVTRELAAAKRPAPAALGHTESAP